MSNGVKSKEPDWTKVQNEEAQNLSDHISRPENADRLQFIKDVAKNPADYGIDSKFKRDITNAKDAATWWNAMHFRGKFGGGTSIDSLEREFGFSQEGVPSIIQRGEETTPGFLNVPPPSQLTAAQQAMEEFKVTASGRFLAFGDLSKDEQALILAANPGLSADDVANLFNLEAMTRGFVDLTGRVSDGQLLLEGTVNTDAQAQGAAALSMYYQFSYGSSYEITPGKEAVPGTPGTPATPGTVTWEPGTVGAPGEPIISLAIPGAYYAGLEFYMVDEQGKSHKAEYDQYWAEGNYSGAADLLNMKALRQDYGSKADQFYGLLKQLGSGSSDYPQSSEDARAIVDKLNALGIGNFTVDYNIAGGFTWTTKPGDATPGTAWGALINPDKFDQAALSQALKDGKWGDVANMLDPAFLQLALKDNVTVQDALATLKGQGFQAFLDKLKDGEVKDQLLAAREETPGTPGTLGTPGQEGVAERREVVMRTTLYEADFNSINPKYLVETASVGRETHITGFYDATTGAPISEDRWNQIALDFKLNLGSDNIYGIFGISPGSDFGVRFGAAYRQLLDPNNPSAGFFGFGAVADNKGNVEFPVELQVGGFGIRKDFLNTMADPQISYTFGGRNGSFSASVPVTWADGLQFGRPSLQYSNKDITVTWAPWAAGGIGSVGVASNKPGEKLYDTTPFTLLGEGVIGVAAAGLWAVNAQLYIDEYNKERKGTRSEVVGRTGEAAAGLAEQLRKDAEAAAFRDFNIENPPAGWARGDGFIAQFRRYEAYIDPQTGEKGKADTVLTYIHDEMAKMDLASTDPATIATNAMRLFSFAQRVELLEARVNEYIAESDRGGQHGNKLMYDKYTKQYPGLTENQIEGRITNVNDQRDFEEYSMFLRITGSMLDELHDAKLEANRDLNRLDLPRELRNHMQEIGGPDGQMMQNLLGWDGKSALQVPLRDMPYYLAVAPYIVDTAGLTPLAPAGAKLQPGASAPSELFITGVPFNVNWE